MVSHALPHKVFFSITIISAGSIKMAVVHFHLRFVIEPTVIIHFSCQFLMKLAVIMLFTTG